VPDGVEVDLSLVKLPDGALMFPSPLHFDPSRPRTADAVTKAFGRLARGKLGFPACGSRLARLT